MKVVELKSCVEDASASLEINKTFLKELVAQKLLEQQSGDFYPVFFKIFGKLHSESVALEEELRQKCKECEKEYTTALISAQLANETELRQRKKVLGYEETVWENEYLIERRDRVLETVYMKNQQLIAELGTIKDNRHLIVSPPERQLLEQHVLVEHTRGIMQGAARDLYGLLQYKTQLKEQCAHLKNDCETIETLLSNPVNRRGTVDKGVFKQRYTELPREIQYTSINEFEGVSEEKFRLPKEKMRPPSREDKQNEHLAQRYKETAKKLKQEVALATGEVVAYLSANEGLKKEGEQLSKKYEKLLLELDHMLRKSEAYDLAFPRSSIQVNHFSKDQVAFRLPGQTVNAESLYGSPNK